MSLLIGLSLPIIVLIIIGLLVVFILLWGIATYNGFISLKNNCEEAFSTMDVYLKKRYDLIPNLVETVKGYAKHEKSTLEDVIKARNSAMNASNVDEELAMQGDLQKTLGRLFAIAEAYPDLKANQNFLDLQNQLQNIEQEIASSRKYYNAVVKQFNNKVQQVPSNIIAGMFHFSTKKMYEVDNVEERSNVKVSF
ncbi:MAG: LemA family protein [Bacilli bacterium]|jgi:LemA protein|nr:LemA family protein [Bacilli bacterium]